MHLYRTWRYHLTLALLTLSQFALADPTTGSGGIGG